MGNEFVIKHGFISKGDSIVNGTISGETLNLTSIPSNDNSQTQVLVRNNTSGIVEYRDASTFSGSSGSNTFVTGFTYNDNNTFTIFDNDGGSFPATINQVSGLTVNGTLSATTLDGNTILSGGTNLLTIIDDRDTFVTGTTYGGNQAVLTRNDGTEVFKLSGSSSVQLTNPSSNQIDIDVTIPPGMNTYVTGGTYNEATDTITLTRNDAVTVDITGITDTFTTGATYDNGTTLATFTKNNGTTYTLDLSTIDVNDTFVTGTTFGSNQATVTRNDGTDVLFLTGGTNVTLSNPSTNQIKFDVSIPSDMNTYVTGFTYNDANTFTISDNSGSTFNATINTVTGLTVNGILSATTISATTFYGDGSNLTGVGGGSSIRNVSSTDTFATANETINCTSGTFIVNLPTAVGIQGTTYTLVNSGTGTITMKGTLGQTINGSATIDLKRQHISRTVQSNGVDWIVI